jgi:hypothetical protein
VTPGRLVAVGRNDLFDFVGAVIKRANQRAREM